MGETTHISWADHTFNPWMGCTRISNGPLGACAGCYAAVVVEDRFGRAEFGGPGKGVGTRARTSEANWKQPLAWDRKAAREGTRPFVFCASLADVFDNAVPVEWRADLFRLIDATPHLCWLLLTKRPGNIVPLYEEARRINLDGTRWTSALPEDRRRWPRNAAIGCTVVTQEEADRDVPKLLRAKAALGPAFAFVSMEPLMGPVDLTKLEVGRGSATFPGAPEVTTARLLLNGLLGAASINLAGLDWVITGGETDQGSHRARPSHPQWFRDLRDQCAAAGVPFHHKQNGEWVSVSEVEGPGAHFSFPDSSTVRRTGKKLAGRTIDGRVHDARPEPREAA